MNELTHINKKGESRMVDVSHKPVVVRKAIARGEIRMEPETLEIVLKGEVPKGEVFNTARVAGIMAAKKTSEIIPLCHPLPLTAIDLRFYPVPDDGLVVIEAAVRTAARTGVEMEALSAVAAAALTVYDMAKAVDKGMRIDNIRLVEKTKSDKSEL